jgi:hypothetical protein
MLFSSRPNETASLQTIARFGPVGMGINLGQPAFTMTIHSIEAGSPAEAAGKLKPGQIIESINGQTLKDIDPRIQLAAILTEAEATDGLMTFVVRDTADAAPQEVVVTLPVLGSYSESWPLDCPKSDRIVRGFGDYLAAVGWGDGHCGLNGPALLFLLSTGEEKDLDTAREWIKQTIAFYEANPAPFKNWRLGYGGVPLAEYYLRTGDPAILPIIQKYADLAREHHYLGGWAHGGTGLFPYMNGGHMNAAGAHVLSFLLLAKECGVDVDERTLQSSLRQFFRFAGRGLTPYGDARPEFGFVDNGRCGRLALAMAAAASLTPDGEESIYAMARDACAMKSFTTGPWMNHGHTGGGIGEVWRNFAMGLLHERRPLQYRSYMDHRKWFYELSRRHDGSFGILGGGRYDGAPGTTPTWGHTMGLAYTAPRKTLQITGAPKTRHCRSYQLPTRPWGNAADDCFLSLEPAVEPDGSRLPVEKETFDGECAREALAKLRDPEVDEETVRRYAYHPDTAVRNLAARCAAGMTPDYMYHKPAETARYPALITAWLRSDDPRVRWTGAFAIAQLPGELLTEERFALLAAMVDNPAESWFVADQAMQTMSSGRPEWVAPHVERLLHFLQHDEWWLRNAALSALMPVIADTAHYRRIYPVLSRTIAENQRYKTLLPLNGLAEALTDADPVVQQAAVKMLGRAYTEFSQRAQVSEVSNRDGEIWHLNLLARFLAGCPGGLEELLAVSQKRFPSQPLQHRNEFLHRMESASTQVKRAVKPIILDELIPQHVARHYGPAGIPDRGYAAFAGGRNDAIDQLVDLYRKAGVEGYDWHLFGPDLKCAEWWYHSFDPPETLAWDQAILRARRVTIPEGMEQWHAKTFDPKAAGWKQGRSPFGQYDGKIPEERPSCQGPGCWCGTPVNTLWEKEVILFQGTFKLPPARDGYRYRLRVNDGDHVGTGSGYQVFINGKQVINSTQPPKRGQGGLPKGIFLAKEWFDALEDGEVTIAVKNFLRYNTKYRRMPIEEKPIGRISVHFEEMKRPPYTHDMVVKAATVVPMMTAEWQAKQFGDAAGAVDDEAREKSAEDVKFRWNGTVESNPALLGAWTLLGRVHEIADFTPGEELPTDFVRGRPPFSTLTIKDAGRTDHPARLWSGNILMNLNRFEALRMVTRKLDGQDYLFVEAGEFHSASGIPVGWTSPWCVMSREDSNTQYPTRNLQQPR